jgi:hypothetical protein
MDLWHILALVALVGLSLSVFRESARHGDFGQLARLERKVDLIMRHLGLEADLRVEVPAHVHELAHSGQKVEAIRKLRQGNPWLTLKEAKAYVEGLAGR